MMGPNAQNMFDDKDLLESSMGLHQKTIDQAYDFGLSDGLGAMYRPGKASSEITSNNAFTGFSYSDEQQNIIRDAYNSGFDAGLNMLLGISTDIFNTITNDVDSTQTWEVNNLDSLSADVVGLSSSCEHYESNVEATDS